MPRFNYWYAFVKVYMTTTIHLFYRRYHISGYENVPASAPIIFAPNHQNTLMDALVTVCATDRQPSFLTRSDVFNNPATSWLLYSLKMIPIYRIRDGVDALQKNNEVFDKCVRYLTEKDTIIIFPEGTHDNIRRLRKPKKGIMRIAFAAEEKANFTLGIHIVPVGLNYSDYRHFNNDLYIRFGKAIPLLEYKEKYLKNPPATMLAVMDDLYLKLKEVAIHIEDEEHYYEYEHIREMYRSECIGKDKNYNNQFEKAFLADKELISRIDNYKQQSPEGFELLISKVKNYFNKLKELNLKDKQLSKKPECIMAFFKCLLVLLFSPFFLEGFVLNILPFRVIKKLISGFKDVSWYSSMKIVGGMFIIPLVYIIEFIIVCFIFKGHWIIWAFLASIPLCDWLSWKVVMNYRFIRDYKRYRFAMKKRKMEMMMVKELRSDIVEQIDSVINSNNN